MWDTTNDVGLGEGYAPEVQDPEILWQLFGAADGSRAVERQYAILQELPMASRQGLINFASKRLARIYRALKDVPPSERPDQAYHSAYACYIRVRRILGPSEMKRLIWSRLKELPMWAFWDAWRNARRKKRSAKRKEWLKGYRASAAQKAAEKRYAASEKRRAVQARYRANQRKKLLAASKEAA